MFGRLGSKRKDLKALNQGLKDLRLEYVSSIRPSLQIQHIHNPNLPFDQNYVPLSLTVRDKPDATVRDLLPTPDQAAPIHWLVLGEPGIGKTTLSLSLMSEWAKQSDPVYKQFEWVFRIDLTKLMRQDRYPEKENKEPVRLAEILIQECLMNGDKCLDAIKAIPQRSNKYLYDELETLATGIVRKKKWSLSGSASSHHTPKVLLILDGIDNLILPTHLQDAFTQLMQCPYVIVLSATTDLKNLPAWTMSSQQSIPVEIAMLHGINPVNIMQYLKICRHAYHEHELWVNAIDMLFQFINDKLDLSYAKSPLLLQILYFLWYNASAVMEALVQNKQKLSLTCVMEMFIEWSCRGIKRRIFDNFCESEIHELFHAELLFAEHLAFKCVREGRNGSEYDSSRRYVHGYLESLFSDASTRQKFLQEYRKRNALIDFNQPELPSGQPELTDAEMVSNNLFSITLLLKIVQPYGQFILLPLRDFFAAKYLARHFLHSIQKKKNSGGSDNTLEIFPDWDCGEPNKYSCVEDYIRATCLLESHRQIYLFMEEIVKSASKTKTTLIKFLELIMREPVLANLIPLLQKPELKGYQFKLTRQSPVSLRIECIASPHSTKRTYWLCSLLETALKNDLASNLVANVQFETDDGEQEILTISTDSCEKMNSIAKAIRTSFKALQVYSLTSTFFTGKTNISTVVNNNNETDSDDVSHSCQLQ